MCLSADWAGMLALSNSIVPCLCCVWFLALGRASALAFFCRPCFGWSVASVLPVWFSFRGAAGLLSFVAAVWCFGWLPSLFFLPMCLGCVRFNSLSPGSTLPPTPLVGPLCLLVQSVLCWSLPPGIWLYLQRSGCHIFDVACCG